MNKNKQTAPVQRLGDMQYLSLYGNDAGGSAWVMGKMNMILHGIEKQPFLENTDEFTDPAHLDAKGQRLYFDRILANPPFSMNYEREGMKFTERFHYGFCKETGNARTSCSFNTCSFRSRAAASWPTSCRRRPVSRGRGRYPRHRLRVESGKLPKNFPGIFSDVENAG